MAWRAEVRNGIYNNVLVPFKAANPSLQEIYRARPESFTAMPALYIAGFDEPTILLDQGTRRIDLLATLMLVDVYSDNAEVTDRLDTLTDALRDYLSARANVHRISDNGVQFPVSVRANEVTVGDVPYAAVAIVVSCRLQEGRA